MSSFLPRREARAAFPRRADKRALPEQGARLGGLAGSMNRPAASMGVVLIEGDHIGIVELVGRQDAVILTLCSVLPL